MPTYEYLCRQCGDRMEVWQSFKDDPLSLHESCGGSLRKVFHARGVVFKGPGFYVTDSRKPNPTNRGANGQSSESSRDDASGDSKSSNETTKVRSSESKKASSE